MILRVLLERSIRYARYTATVRMTLTNGRQNGRVIQRRPPAATLRIHPNTVVLPMMPLSSSF